MTKLISCELSLYVDADDTLNQAAIMTDGQLENAVERIGEFLLKEVPQVLERVNIIVHQISINTNVDDLGI
ncbi:hypothetical protein [Sphingomonas crocodyli]|uniref:Uncharacterized protein n=1 Tax=Sphingomonas crocodyli TaxID=1979270 RepID=A0A437M707_9SPHN|nr:hypothetical protein [Sphingomonas crocodyli]RVT93417.1 hypothetical protein EOD43_05950 [Sphingomonas crocodyli]